MNDPKDIRVKARIPLIKGRAVLFVDSPRGEAGQHVALNKERIRSAFRSAGYRFLYLPDMTAGISHDMMRYSLPGEDPDLLVMSIYETLGQMSGAQGRAGLLYRAGRRTFFRPFPSGDADAIMDSVDGLAAVLGSAGMERATAAPRKREEAKVRKEEDLITDSEGTKKERRAGRKEDTGIRFSVTGDEQEELPLDPSVQEIIDDWNALSRRHGITIDDLYDILGKAARPSRLGITRSFKIHLIDIEGGPEIVMDDLSRTLYLFYLNHPEGVAFKDLVDHEKEMLDIYMRISGRGDADRIRETVAALVSPLGGSTRNPLVSRIKKAFRDVVDDRIARNYYIRGERSEKRSISLDRSLVIREEDGHQSHS